VHRYVEGIKKMEESMMWEGIAKANDRKIPGLSISASFKDCILERKRSIVVLKRKWKSLQLRQQKTLIIGKNYENKGRKYRAKAQQMSRHMLNILSELTKVDVMIVSWQLEKFTLAF
jgi:hypothetical protein